MTRHLRWSRWPVTVLKAFAVQACIGAATPSPGLDDVSAGPSTTSGTRQPGDCISIVHSVNPKPQALEVAGMAAQASIVVEAAFLGNAGPAVWNTPDGHRPTQDEVRREGATLSTPLKLGSIADLRSTLPPDGRVMVEGGTNGCDTWNYDDPTATPLEIGKRYVFFLNPGVDTQGIRCLTPRCSVPCRSTRRGM